MCLMSVILIFNNCLSGNVNRPIFSKLNYWHFPGVCRERAAEEWTWEDERSPGGACDGDSEETVRGVWAREDGDGGSTRGTKCTGRFDICTYL